MEPRIMSSWFIEVGFHSLTTPPLHQPNFHTSRSSQTFPSAYHAQAVAAKATGGISAMESSQNSQLMVKPEGEGGIQSQLDFITGSSLRGPESPLSCPKQVSVQMATLFSLGGRGTNPALRGGKQATSVLPPPPLATWPLVVFLRERDSQPERR